MSLVLSPAYWAGEAHTAVPRALAHLHRRHALARADQAGPAILIIIGIALVLAVGLAVAWWITCQNKGGLYPALDMPSWNSGGTWKAYCRA